MDSQLQAKLATLRQALDLPRPPIALAFVDTPPAGVAAFAEAVPSACAFWRVAEREVFYASEQQHLNCPVGVMTMGFQIPPERRAEADAIVGTMCNLEYITLEEARALPTVEKPHRGIVYGPLAQMPVDPDIALFFCRPGQAMLLAEASGCVDWTGMGMAAMGRPTCAALPMALRSGKAALSMGCIGFRVYTQIPDQELLIAVPGDQLPALVERLDTIVSANAALQEFHTGRRASI
jgi:uncharacterized protein (DUF169 family)